MKDLRKCQPSNPMHTFFKKLLVHNKNQIFSLLPCADPSLRAIALRSRMTGAGSVGAMRLITKAQGYRAPPCGGRWILRSKRRKESACIKSYRLYTILDNHTYGSIYSSHNLSFHLYFTRSPSPDCRRELPPQGA